MKLDLKNLDKGARLLTAKNGFVLHISPNRAPRKVKAAKSTGSRRIYGISYTFPDPMPVTLNN